MNERQRKTIKRMLLSALKIAVGSSIAIYIAEWLNLEFATSAGSIALLTLVTTKWETVKLSIARIATFVIAITLMLAILTFDQAGSDWVLYGIYVFLIVMICGALGWKATISVNAVIGTHFLTTRTVDNAFIWNELQLVLLGITIAIILNLFHDYQGQKNGLIKDMRMTEERLREILIHMAAYLRDGTIKGTVWEDIQKLQEDLQPIIADAYAYQDNTFVSHPGYYIDYFEMRMDQVEVLDNLHGELRKIRSIPKQSQIVADYIEYLKDFVIETHDPIGQIEWLEQIFLKMKEEPLPVTREEFENRAVLYHVLMDLEEFLLYKKKFVEGLDQQKKRIYWKM